MTGNLRKIDATDGNENFERLGLNISGCSVTRSVCGNLTCGHALLCAIRDFGLLLVDNCISSTRQRIMSVLQFIIRSASLTKKNSLLSMDMTSLKSKLFRSLYEGSADLGFSISLDVQTNESTFSTPSSGLAIIVHDQYTFVNYHSGFKVQTGSHSSVAITLTQVNAHP
ncbi:uncharacterized protein LOC111321623 [Stylophora pistillata]|uniref:uncharacterized protein LOC111321623 n=1 Tax=Stylophora pistillata TaxID=50429 RepID=UPI000C041421|nr:uncharacterized protein LOC111321623 [Stylophora pistillata]